MDKLEVQVAHLEERAKSNSHRIDRLEEEVSEIKDLTIAVKEIATETKHMREEQISLNNRLSTIEGKPAKNWDKVVSTIIGTIVGGVVGALIGLILK